MLFERIFKFCANFTKVLWSNTKLDSRYRETKICVQLIFITMPF